MGLPATPYSSAEPLKQSRKSVAVIDQIPAPEIIMAYRGVLDFYVHRGQAIVRAWPRPPSAPRVPAVTAAASTFGAIAHRLSSTAPLVQQMLARAYAGSEWTWRDAATSGQYGHAIELTP